MFTYWHPKDKSLSYINKKYKIKSEVITERLNAALFLFIQFGTSKKSFFVEVHLNIKVLKFFFYLSIYK